MGPSPRAKGIIQLPWLRLVCFFNKLKPDLLSMVPYVKLILTCFILTVNFFECRLHLQGRRILERRKES
jgi:hypothetical protein